MFPIGLGCMPMSGRRNLAHRERSIRTVHAALDGGVTMFDTANVYAPSGALVGHNEELLAEAMRSWPGPASSRARVIVATKGGLTRSASEVWERDGSRAGLLAAAEASATRLGGGPLDLYYLHRLDPALPFDEQIGGLQAVRDAGLARRIGLSNVTAGQVRRALALVGGPADGGICAVQNERSPRYRAAADVLDLCREHGILYVPWSPLRIGDDALPVFSDVAHRQGATAQQVALAWLLAGSDASLPIPGSSRPETIRASLASVDLRLDGAEMDLLNSTAHDDVSAYPDDQPPPPMP